MNETKDKILNAAIELWSLDPTTPLEDIAKHIDISRRTLHRHYKGREGLVSNVLNHLTKEYLKSVKQELSSTNESLLQQIKKLFYNDIRNANNYIVYHNLLKTSDPTPSPNDTNIEELHKIYSSLFHELQTKGHTNNFITISWIELFYSSTIEAAIKAIRQGAVTEDIIVTAWQSFWNGIKK